MFIPSSSLYQIHLSVTCIFAVLLAFPNGCNKTVLRPHTLCNPHWNSQQTRRMLINPQLSPLRSPALPISALRQPRPINRWSKILTQPFISYREGAPITVGRAASCDSCLLPACTTPTCIKDGWFPHPETSVKRRLPNHDHPSQWPPTSSM